jgi:hypothetical protein
MMLGSISSPLSTTWQHEDHSQHGDEQDSSDSHR